MHCLHKIPRLLASLPFYCMNALHGPGRKVLGTYGLQYDLARDWTTSPPVSTQTLHLRANAEWFLLLLYKWVLWYFNTVSLYGSLTTGPSSLHLRECRECPLAEIGRVISTVLLSVLISCVAKQTGIYCSTLSWRHSGNRLICFALLRLPSELNKKTFPSLRNVFQLYYKWQSFCLIVWALNYKTMPEAHRNTFIKVFLTSGNAFLFLVLCVLC